MKKLLITKEKTIKDAMAQLNNSGEKCLVVAKSNLFLLGTLSNGDIRKIILKGIDIYESIENFYNKKSTYFQENEYLKKDIKSIMLKNNFDLIPIISNSGKVVKIITLSELFQENNKDTRKLSVPVVIMAGGKGSRMEPFTKVLPKPLIPVHDKPIINYIIDRFVSTGIDDFHITINYKGKILKAYFDELTPKYNVAFHEEKKALGTAGSLNYIKNIIKKPFFVTNCDIIVKTNYFDLYDYHIKGKYDLTVVASAKEYIIPYGTCEIDDKGQLLNINEKPRYNFLVNTGLYILNPDILELIPVDEFFHITNLIEDAIKIGKKVGVYPINDDSWIDVGEWSEFKNAIDRL
jgi:dTDP-glucose pyrophosphorylase